MLTHAMPLHNQAERYGHFRLDEMHIPNSFISNNYKIVCGIINLTEASSDKTQVHPQRQTLELRPLKIMQCPRRIIMMYLY